MRMQASSFLLASVLIAGSVGAAAAQGLGGGETKTPNSPVTSPNDPGINNPNSPTTSNRGDPGTEPVNPNSGGPAMGQGQEQAPGTVGAGARTVDPEGAKNDPHTTGVNDAPIPDPTRPSMPPTRAPTNR
jgi:hypothetical protein